MADLPLTPIVDVTYRLTTAGAEVRGFNEGLILGSSAVIPSNEVVREYATLAEMAADGFASTDPEYKAAQFYFSATVTPRILAVGRQFSGQSPLLALQECREANGNWYAAVAPETIDAEQQEIAEYFEALTEPYSMYMFQSDDAAILANSPGNLFATFKGQAFRRTWGEYSADPYRVAGTLGCAMGRVTGLPDSAYTMMFKQIPGGTPDALTTNQINNVQGNYGNVYVTRAGRPLIEKGSVFSGNWFDDIIFPDKLANAIQVAVFNELYQNSKIPQTEAGMAQLRAAVSQSCQDAVIEGYLAPGRWTGDTILTLNTGDYLPSGYVVMSESIAAQSVTDRNDRKAPPIFACVKTAGAIQSVTVIIDVNR